jgi:DNA gyrase/topoisomerase IV subunit B
MHTYRNTTSVEARVAVKAAVAREAATRAATAAAARAVAARAVAARAEAARAAVRAAGGATEEVPGKLRRCQGRR